LGENFGERERDEECANEPRREGNGSRKLIGNENSDIHDPVSLLPEQAHLLEEKRRKYEFAKETERKDDETLTWLPLMPPAWKSLSIFSVSCQISIPFASLKN